MSKQQNRQQQKDAEILKTFDDLAYAGGDDYQPRSIAWDVAERHGVSYDTVWQLHMKREREIFAAKNCY